jgi:predicted alpha/beta-fold hydrolase
MKDLMAELLKMHSELQTQILLAQRDKNEVKTQIKQELIKCNDTDFLTVNWQKVHKAYQM